MHERPAAPIISGVFVAGSILLVVGIAVAAVFVPPSLRELWRAKEAAALTQWNSAPPETTRAIRMAWRRGAAIADPDGARLALTMSNHLDRVFAATNRVSWWACAPVAPGLVLLLGSLSRVAWVIVGAPLLLLLVSHPVAVRSRKLRRRSIDLTKQQHAL